MINIRRGDVLNHENNYILCHCCNNVGGYGSGFVANLNKVSDAPRKHYFKWYNDGFTQTASGLKIPFKLGEAQFVSLYPAKIDKIIANIIGQDGIIGDKERMPVRYWAIRKGLERVKEKFDINKNTGLLDNHDIIAPLLCTGLAGGHLDEIYSIVNDIFGSPQYPFYFYAFSDLDYKNLDKVARSFSN